MNSSFPFPESLTFQAIWQREIRITESKNSTLQTSLPGKELAPANSIVAGDTSVLRVSNPHQMQGLGFNLWLKD